jgi:hypothetical protein
MEEKDMKKLTKSIIAFAMALTLAWGGAPQYNSICG